MCACVGQLHFRFVCFVYLHVRSFTARESVDAVVVVSVTSIPNCIRIRIAYSNASFVAGLAVPCVEKLGVIVVVVVKD